MTHTTRPSEAKTAPPTDRPSSAAPATPPSAAGTAGSPQAPDIPGAPDAPAATGAAGSATAEAPRPRKERDPYFDNAKYFAILLVVSGHSIAYLLNVPMAKGLYIFIYMFHMPLFILITGYLSRNWTFSGSKARKLITNVGVPYVVFEFAYSIYDWLVGGNKLEISLLRPYYLTWFLLALFLWRLSTPVWQQIRWPLAVATVFALLSYMSNLGGTFDIHRVIGLLPFYVLGLTLKPQHFELLKKPIARLIGACVLIAGLGMSYLVMDHMDRAWIYWKHPHYAFGISNLSGTMMRLAMFACAFMLVAAFLSVIPRKRHWFTKLGAATLYTYLLHGFITRLFTFEDWWDAKWMNSPSGVLIVLACALVVGTVLSTRPVVRSMRWALEPKMAWVFTPLRRPGGSR